MIQRIQTVYLALVTIIGCVIIFILSLWNTLEQKVMAFDLLSSKNVLLQLIPILFLVSGVMAFVTILLFKNRKLQFVFNRLNILINLFLLGILLYYLLMLPGEITISEKGIGVFLPILNVVLLVLSNKAIQKDENLVKSVDRLR